MDITVSQAELSKKLSLVQGIIESRSAMPVLSHILLSAEKSGSTIKATDLAVSVCEDIQTTISGVGVCCIPGRKFAEIVRELSGDIRLVADKSALKITSGGSSFKVNCLPAKDFPSWPTFEATQSFKIAKTALASAFRKTSYSAGKDDQRHTLNGLLLHCSGNNVTIVATDGHRMSVVNEKVESSLEEIKVVIPYKAVLELQKKFLTGEEAVEVTIGKNHTRFVMEGVEFLTRNIDGIFPDYSKVTPATSGDGLIVDRAALYSSVKRVSLMTSRNTVSVGLSNNKMTISSSQPDLGEASDSLDCQYSGDEQTVGFNADFLEDALTATEGEKVSLFITGSVAPIVMHTSGDGNHLNVIMPIRL